LEEARREGQVPRSRHLAHLLLLGGAALALFMLGDPLLADLRAVLARGLAFDARPVRDPARMTAAFRRTCCARLLAVAPVLVILLAAAFAAPLAVGGWLFRRNLPRRVWTG